MNDQAVHADIHDPGYGHDTLDQERSDRARDVLYDSEATLRLVERQLNELREQMPPKTTVCADFQVGEELFWEHYEEDREIGIYDGILPPVEQKNDADVWYCDPLDWDTTQLAE